MHLRTAWKYVENFSYRDFHWSFGYLCACPPPQPHTVVLAQRMHVYVGLGSLGNRLLQNPLLGFIFSIYLTEKINHLYRNRHVEIVCYKTRPVRAVAGWKTIGTIVPMVLSMRQEDTELDEQ
jgi:hypothetical protein